MRIIAAAALATVLMAMHAMASSTKTKSGEGFVKKSDCIWERPTNCPPKDSLSSSFQIDLHVTEGDTSWEEANGFPTELKRATRVASNTWLRVIRSRPTPPIGMDLSGVCGGGRGKTIEDNAKVGDLVICLNLVENDDKTIASAQILDDYIDPLDGLPRVVLISINLKQDGIYDQCDWNSIMMHEIAHALGFAPTIFSDNGLLHTSWDGTSVFTGKNAKREWESMGGSDDSNRYPRLTSHDGSHWSDICFDKHELMVPGHRPSDSVAALGNNVRAPISRLTLGVFQDLGFDVDMRCADYDIMLRYIPRCRRGGRGPSKWRRNRERKKTQYRSTDWKGRRDLTLQQFFQILRYEFRKDLTTCRKQILRFGRILKRTRKKATKLWIPNVQKNCRKTHRRIRRVTRKNIRGASPALQWEWEREGF